MTDHPDPAPDASEALEIVRDKIEGLNSLINSGAAKAHQIRYAKEQLEEWLIIDRALTRQQDRGAEHEPWPRLSLFQVDEIGEKGSSTTIVHYVSQPDERKSGTSRLVAKDGKIEAVKTQPDERDEVIKHLEERRDYWSRKYCEQEATIKALRRLSTELWLKEKPTREAQTIRSRISLDSVTLGEYQSEEDHVPSYVWDLIDVAAQRALNSRDATIKALAEALRLIEQGEFSGKPMKAVTMKCIARATLTAHAEIIGRDGG